MKHILPNFLTILRILLIVPIIYAFLEQQFHIALWLFVLAAISDALDGIIARRLGSTSRFGSIADPVADKFLLMSCFLLLFYFEMIPWWLVLMVIMRDLIIFFGALAYHYIVGPYELVPSQISKINTFLQLVYVLLFLIDLAYTVIPDPVLNASTWVVLVVVLSSGFDYIWTWGSKALVAKQHGNRGIH